MPLKAGGAASHKRDQSSVGIMLGIKLADDTAPVVAVVVMVFPRAKSVGVESGLGMHLRLAKVAPPAADTLVGKRTVALEQPPAGSGIGHVKHTGVAYPCRHIVYIAILVAGEHPTFGEQIVIVDSAFLVDIRLGYQHCIHPACLQPGKHAAVVGPADGIPGELAHVGFLAKPVEVKHHTVDRKSLTLQRVNYPYGLLLRLITVFRGDVAQRPEWRQILSAGQT